MVTTVEKPEGLPWDAFIESDLARRGVDSFRRVQWPNLRRDLKMWHDIEITDEEEPHWVIPGQAVYWQEPILRKRVEINDAVGSHWAIEEVREAWQPTPPLPANNPGQIAHYLGKGFRLRPPQDAVVDVEVYTEAAAPAEGAKAFPSRTYVCSRHAGLVSFNSWKAYLRHCEHRREGLEELPPERVKQAMARYDYFCLPHNNGFNSRRAATAHVNGFRAPMPRGRGISHIPVEQMEVKKDAI